MSDKNMTEEQVKMLVCAVLIVVGMVIPHFGSGIVALLFTCMMYSKELSENLAKLLSTDIK